MNKEIKYSSSYSGHTFRFYDNEKFISSLFYDISLSSWYVYYLDKSAGSWKIHDVSNIIHLSYEQYFQELIVWDYPFPLESAYGIIKLHQHNIKFRSSINYYTGE